MTFLAKYKPHGIGPLRMGRTLHVLFLEMHWAGLGDAEEGRGEGRRGGGPSFDIRLFYVMCR